MIVETHGGEIRVESDSGKGSTFWVTLQVKDATWRKPSC
jgi:signal transduction histidine kinase